MRLIVLTAPEPQPDEISVLHGLFAAGLDRLHLRKPSWQSADFDTFLQHFSKDERGKIWIHRQPDLVERYNLAGVHLSHPGLSIPYRPKVSFSFHSLEELASVPPEQSGFLSPIFPSISKTGYAANWDLKALSEVVRQHPNIAALGGICPERLPQAADLGFESAAVLGWLWNGGSNAEILSRWKRLQELC
jgi:thiamine-phosphate pyrophosphorylase